MKNKKLFEITKQNRFILKFNLNIGVADLSFRSRCNELKKISRLYEELRRNNQWIGLYDEFDLVESKINDVLALHYIMPDRDLVRRLERLRLLLPKIQQTKQDLQNHSWDWLSIKF